MLKLSPFVLIWYCASQPEERFTHSQLLKWPSNADKDGAIKITYHNYFVCLKKLFWVLLLNNCLSTIPFSKMLSIPVQFTQDISGLFFISLVSFQYFQSCPERVSGSKCLIKSSVSFRLNEEAWRGDQDQLLHGLWETPQRAGEYEAHSAEPAEDSVRACHGPGWYPGAAGQGWDQDVELSLFTSLYC